MSPAENTVVWDTGLSIWPYSHIVLPVFCVWLLSDTAFLPWVRIGIVVAIAALLEVVELLDDINESKSDVIMDIVQALLGATTGVALLSALNIRSLNIFGNAHGLAFWLIAAALISLFFGLHHHLCRLATSETHVDADRGVSGLTDGIYVFPKYLVTIYAMIAATSVATVLLLRRGGQRPSRWWFILPLLVAMTVSSPLLVQPDDGWNNGYMTIIISFLCVSTTLVALTRRRRDIASWFQSQITYRAGGLPRHERS